MIPNNNLSVLPWYTDIEQQNARKWWVYGRVYPLFTPAGFILPFQLLVEHASETTVTDVTWHNVSTGATLSVLSMMQNTGLAVKQFSALGYDAVVYPGQLPAFTSMENGRYFISMRVNGVTYYSDVFTVVNDISPYLKLEWWDMEDFTMDAGTIVYTEPEFKNVLYLKADIAKPEYPFEEEGETRDGYFFPVKQISEKRYRFSFLASEYLLDVLRFVRMADYARITKAGQVYAVDSFLITPEWENNGDVAAVEAEFDTATVAKKIGVGYIKSNG